MLDFSRTYFKVIEKSARICHSISVLEPLNLLGFDEVSTGKKWCFQKQGYTALNPNKIKDLGTR